MRDGALPLRHPARLLATWFGCGLLPRAPGTWGSLAALPFAWGLAAAGGWPALAVGAVLLFAIGLWACQRVVDASGAEDPGECVIDEVAGQWLALVAAPLDPLAYAFGFAAFRLFDIVKPWPASWADRELKGGLGIMLDDIFAGLYAAALVFALGRWVGW
jgi:phosphatidylglycerophosphatase A